MQMGFKSYNAARKLSGGFPLQILLQVDFQMFAEIWKKLFPYKIDYFLYSKSSKRTIESVSESEITAIKKK